jgi:hypothetical protein
VPNLPQLASADFAMALAPNLSDKGELATVVAIRAALSVLCSSMQRAKMCSADKDDDRNARPYLSDVSTNEMPLSNRVL